MYSVWKISPKNGWSAPNNDVLFCLCCNIFNVHTLLSLHLFQRLKSRSQTSLSEEPSEWRTRACSRSPSNQQKSTDKSVKDMDSKFSIVKNFHLSQMLQKTSSYCEWTNTLSPFVHYIFHCVWFDPAVWGTAHEYGNFRVCPRSSINTCSQSFWLSKPSVRGWIGSLSLCSLCLLPSGLFFFFS